MQSLLINGKYYGFPGDRESLIHLFKAGESSKDSQYKETDSQLGASEITLGNPGGSHLQKGTRKFLCIMYTGVESLFTMYISRVFELL